MADANLSEAMRAIALKRWEGTTPEQRRRNTAAALAAVKKNPPKTARQKIAELEERLARVEQLLSAAA